jgi:hypothetical protein
MMVLLRVYCKISFSFRFRFRCVFVSRAGDHSVVADGVSPPSTSSNISKALRNA